MSIEGYRGCLPRTTKVGDGTFRVFGDPGTDTELIPESDYDKWSPTNNLLPYHWHTIDQGPQGTCCKCAGIGAVMLSREQAGQKRVVLSQAFYAFDGIDSRGELIPRRSDNGMAIDTCLQLLQLIGAPPASVIDPMDWQGYRRGRWPEDWREQAAPFKLLEAFDAPTLRHCYSGVFKGFPAVYGAAGHAVIMMGRKPKGEHYDLNSHGRDWKDDGIGQWRSDRETERGIRTYGAWILRVATDPTNDGDLPRKQAAELELVCARGE